MNATGQWVSRRFPPVPALDSMSDKDMGVCCYYGESAALDEFKEADHPRDEDGQFTESGGSGGKSGGKSSIPDEIKQHRQFKNMAARGIHDVVFNKDANGAEFRPKLNPNVKQFHSGREDEPHRISYYDPRYAVLKTEDEDEPLLARQYAAPKPDTQTEIEPLDDPDTIYRGMSAEEYDSILKSGEVKSKGTHNIGERQAGLTYWTTAPEMADSYANGFAPIEAKPTFTHPAYVVATKRPKETREVEGTTKEEVGVERPIRRDEITGVWRGDPYSYDIGRFIKPPATKWGEHGVRVTTPRAKLRWTKIGLPNEQEAAEAPEHPDLIGRKVEHSDPEHAVHFVGFRDGEHYHNAVKVFGKPDFFHYVWDVRAKGDIAPGDTVVFAKGGDDQEPSAYSYDDSNQPDDPAALERLEKPAKKPAQDMAMDESALALKQFLLAGLSQLAMDAEFKEAEHPRDNDGKFTDSGTGLKITNSHAWGTAFETEAAAQAAIDRHKAENPEAAYKIHTESNLGRERRTGHYVEVGRGRWLKRLPPVKRARPAKDAEFKDQQHPRGGDPKHSGRFSKGHGSGGKPEGGGGKPAEAKPAAGKTNGQAGQQQQQRQTQPQPQQQPGQQQQQQQQPAARGVHPGHGYSSASQVINGVIHTTNINDATRALYEGKKVALQQPRQVSTLVARLANIAKRFEQMGGKAPNFDLCNVSVPGTNLFCADTKGIPRVQMPQLPDEKGPAFQKFLMDKGHKATEGTEKASFLRATQSELVGVKVSGIMGYFRTKDASTDPPLFVSKDNYIVDGHHRWAARVGLDAENNQLGQTDVNIVRVDLPIIELLAEAETFTEGKGHKAATAHDKRWSSPRFGARDAFTPQHRPAGSRTGGQFTSQGGGGGAGKTSGPIHASSAAWTGRARSPGSAPGGLGPTATKAAQATKQGIKGLTQEDYETFKKNLPSRQKTLSQNLTGMSKVLPQLLKAHGREEVQKAKHAAGAIASMARGMRPTPEQSKGLRQFAISMMLSVGMFITTGDPTGTLAHGATAVAAHLGQEYAQHAIMEHGATAIGAGARYAYHAATGGGDASMDDLSPEEVKLLQGFMATLAKTVATHQIPDQRLAELFKQGDTSQDTAMDTAFRLWASPRFGPPYRRLAMDRALAMDKSPFTPLRSQRDRIAMDRAPSVRSMNEDGDLRVALSNISKATVNPYWGKEIPNCEGLGLDPERKYMLLRHPKELAKAAGTFNGLPILAEHQPRTSTDHPSDLVVGSTGTDAVYRHPYLMNSLVFWTKPAVDAIANNEQKELSCAYHYEPVMTPGVYEGQRYDGIMTKIRGNHVALVKDGRAGADVVVQDSALKEMHYA